MFDLPPPTPTIQIELASTGISKGLAQSRGPQLVVRPGLTFGALSLEASAKNIESSSGDDGVESYLSAGIAKKAGGFDLSARGGLKSVHAIAGQVDRRAFEMRVEAARKFGAFRATTSFIYSPDDTGSTKSAAFLEGGLAWDVRKGTRIGARLGRRERTKAPDYTAYNVGITQDIIPQLAADVRLYDTDSSDLGYAFKRRLVASLRAKF
jgi:hypothetical protein